MKSYHAIHTVNLPPAEASCRTLFGCACLEMSPPKGALSPLLVLGVLSLQGDAPALMCFSVNHSVYTGESQVEANGHYQSLL